MSITDGNANANAINAFINDLLDRPLQLQHYWNNLLQFIHYMPSNKFREPWIHVAIIPNIAGAAAQYSANLITDALTEWMKPNLGGIIINADNEKQSREVDVSDNMIIVQSASAGDQLGGSNRQYNTDNSAPHPRVWEVSGHLSQSIQWLDEPFILRPTLVLQQTLLDAYSVSRRPILYRSGLCPVPTRVLIEHYDLARTVQGNNAYEVSLRLREYVTYTVPFYTGKFGTGSSGLMDALMIGAAVLPATIAPIVHNTVKIKPTDNPPVSPEIEGTATIAGILKRGETLTIEADINTNEKLTYRWFRVKDGVGEFIPHATAITYKLLDEDVGCYIYITIRSGKYQGVVTSPRVGPIGVYLSAEV